MKKQILRVKTHGLDGGVMVTKSQNLMLRKSDVDQSVGVARQPVAVVSGKCKPLATRYLSNGVSMILWSRTPIGGVEGLWYNRSDAAKDFVLVKEGVEPMCAVATTDGFIVMTESGPLTLREQEDDGTLYVAESVDGIIDGVTLEGLDMGQLTVTTPSMTMTGVDFTRGASQIRSADEKTISEQLVEGYNLLASTAAVGGMWLQPVVARWHLISDKGTRMYSSVPIVMAPNGWQCMGEYSVECEKSGDSSLSVPPINMTAKAYRVQLNVSKEASMRLVAAGVASIEVECSPQYHIVDTASNASIRLTDYGGGNPKLRVMVPGAADYFCSRESVYAEQLGLVAGAIDELAKPILVLHHPILSGETLISPKEAYSVKTEQQLISQAIKGKRAGGTVSADKELLMWILPPHTFTASTATVSGRTVVWGDISPKLSTAMCVKQLFGKWGERSCTGFVRVRRRDGGVYTTKFSLDREPEQWASSVMVPDAEAVKIELYYRREDGQVYYGELPLQRMGDGCYSGMISKSLEGKGFTIYEGVLPTPSLDSITENRHYGGMVAADLESPLLALALAESCDSRIVKLMPAVKSQSTWDFSRCHLYAFTSSGVFAVNINTKNRQISSSQIDTRGVEEAERVARADTEVVMLYGERMLKIMASHAEDIGRTGDYTQVVYDASTEEFWFKDRRGMLEQRDKSLGYVCELSVPFDVENIYSAENRMWVSDTEGVYRMAQTQEAVPIKWIGRVELPIGRRLRFVEFCFAGSEVKADVAVRNYPEPEDGRGGELLKYRIFGKVDMPVKVRVSKVNAACVEVAIEGEVSGDFNFKEIIFHLV